MTLSQPDPRQHNQRVQVAVEQSPAKQLKITVENFDHGLGWYLAGSLSIPLHQLPLLQQALDCIRSDAMEESSSQSSIIPFPGLRIAPVCKNE